MVTTRTIRRGASKTPLACHFSERLGIEASPKVKENNSIVLPCNVAKANESERSGIEASPKGNENNALVLPCHDSDISKANGSLAIDEGESCPQITKRATVRTRNAFKKIACQFPDSTRTVESSLSQSEYQHISGTVEVVEQCVSGVIIKIELNICCIRRHDNGGNTWGCTHSVSECNVRRHLELEDIVLFDILQSEDGSAEAVNILIGVTSHSD